MGGQKWSKFCLRSNITCIEVWEKQIQVLVNVSLVSRNNPQNVENKLYCIEWETTSSKYATRRLNRKDSFLYVISIIQAKKPQQTMRKRCASLGLCGKNSCTRLICTKCLNFMPKEAEKISTSDIIPHRLDVIYSSEYGRMWLKYAACWHSLANKRTMQTP